MLHLVIQMIEDTGELPDEFGQRDKEISDTRPQPIIIEFVEQAILGREADENLTMPERGDASAMADGNTPKRTTSNNHVDLTPFYAHHRGVSRRHALVRFANGKLSIIDLGSTNGTYINEVHLAPHKEYPLEDNDVLRLGFLPLSVSMA